MTLKRNIPSHKHHKSDNLNYPFSIDNSEEKNKYKDTVKSEKQKNKFTNFTYG